MLAPRRLRLRLGLLPRALAPLPGALAPLPGALAPLPGALALPWLVLAVVLAGCGGAAPHGPGGAAGLGPPAARPVRLLAGVTQPPLARHRSYRWLIPTVGAPPAVAAENRARGTRAWRLPGPAADVGGVRWGAVSGYVAADAVLPGATERIYVSAPGARSVRIRIFRVGWYGGRGGREVLDSDPLPVTRQPPCAHEARTGLTACRWRATLSFAVPAAAPSGVYVAQLRARTGESDCLFVVRAPHPAPLLAQLPTATYEAYNGWGGDSLYPGGHVVTTTGTSQGIEVSEQRPYDSVTGAGELFARDVAMIWFLERYGYPVSYTTSASVDADPAQVLGHRALIDFGHSEYWSQRQADAFRRARNRGASLLFFSSDTLAWRIRYARGGTIVGYKEFAARDPDRADPTGPFPDRGAALAGTAYTGCITPRLPVSGPPRYRYYAWAPSPSLAPRWLFAGTGMTAATRIAGIVGYELDTIVPATPAGTEVVGRGWAVCMGTRPEPGDPVPSFGSDVGATTLVPTRAGGLVFATGTLGWELGLEPVPSASPDAPPKPVRPIVRLTRNLLAHVLR